MTKLFLTIDKNNFDFTFYSKDGTEDIDNSLVQKDGFVQCSLKVKLKNLPFQFKLPVIAQITNTAKFSDNTEIHQIITTVDLGYLDLNDPKTFLPFLSLIGSPNTIYVGNATIGSINEHVNLLDYTKSDPVSKNLKPFYIFIFQTLMLLMI